MGNLIPVLTAFVLNFFGIYLFIDPKLSGCGPYLSMIIFEVAVFILVWDIRLYPTSMRKLGSFFSNIMQFLVAAMISEHLISDFWLPLEEDAMHLLPKVAEVEEELLRQGGFECETITEFLKKEETQIAASYCLSLFFLLCVLHATRVVDFRLLRCSPKVFIKDILQRLRIATKKAYRGFGVCGPKCVKWNSRESRDDDGEYGDDCCMGALSQPPLRQARINSRRTAPPNNNRRCNRP